LQRGPHRTVLVFAALRGLWALLLLTAPDGLRRAFGVGGSGSGGDRRVDRRATWVARVLGLRHGVQAIAEATVGPRALVPGAAVDALHAASMVALARLDGTSRRPAERDAAVEAGFVAAGLVLAGSFRRYGPRPADDPAEAPAIPA
jgi:hypothetical protein